MIKTEMTFRDFLAVPFYLLMLGFGFITAVIGGEWTAEQLLNIFKHDQIRTS